MSSTIEKRLTPEQLQSLTGFRPVFTVSKILLFFVLLAAVTAVAWESDSQVLDWVAYAAAGYLWMSIVTFMHEATHNTLFEAKWKNWAFGIITMIPLMVSFVAFKEDHLEHHRYNRSPKDPDAFTMGKRGVLDFVAFYAYVLFGALLTFLHFNLIYPIKYFTPKLWAIHLGEAVLKIGCVWALVTWAKQHQIFGDVMEVWLVPVFFFSLLNSMRFIAEHYETPWDQGKLAGTRTVVSNRVNSFFWNNINWHIGHHLYPRVPAYNLVKLHAMIEPDIAAAGAIVDKSYSMVFLNALLRGPESRERLDKALSERAERETLVVPVSAAA
jgi:fatty acid desaturase